MTTAISQARARALRVLTERPRRPRTAATAYGEQRTLKSAIACKGTGLHSGARVAMTLEPAAPGTGIVFRRTDRPAAEADIPARFDAVADTRLCTVLANEAGTSIGTVEHLMAALRGCGVDNAVVALDGPEVPIMDGSAAPFVFLIECAGTVGQVEPRRVIRVLEPVEVVHGRGAEVRSAHLAPADAAVFDFDIAFDTAAIGRQSHRFELSDGAFKTELADCRTFGFLAEVEQLRAAGLARGGSLANAIVVDGDRVLNEEGLRRADEFVRHKILDAMGDLYLAGAPIIGAYAGDKAGHALNNALLRALFERPEAWCHETAPAEADAIAAPLPADYEDALAEPAPLKRTA
ncbi:MAG: UDP-3-O-acyl-N-acetylglucosamine deacetylase [Azospirillaceae bacterium]